MMICHRFLNSSRCPHESAPNLFVAHSNAEINTDHKLQEKWSQLCSSINIYAYVNICCYSNSSAAGCWMLCNLSIYPPHPTDKFEYGIHMSYAMRSIYLCVVRIVCARVTVDHNYDDVMCSLACIVLCRSVGVSSYISCRRDWVAYSQTQTHKKN